MLGLGFGEIAILLLLALLVVGPERLPKVVRWAGRSYGQLRRAADDLRRAFLLEADRMDAEEWARGEGAAKDLDLTDPPSGISREEWETLSEPLKRRLKAKSKEYQP